VVGHDHHHHSPSADSRALTLVLFLTAAFMVAEVVGGLISGSLALLADAGHMLSDSVSLALALGALSLSARPPTARLSFGFRRAEILAALANGVALVAIAIWIFVEAAGRLSDPPQVAGGTTLLIAIVGLAVNLAGAAILWRSQGASLNMRAAFAHVVADLLGSLGVIVAAVLIITTGWLYADPLVSILIGLLILASSRSVLREATGILLEATPAGIDSDAVGRRICGSPGVVAVRDLHIWTITSGFPALSAHVVVGLAEDCHARQEEVTRMLAHDYGITHTTLQVEHGDGDPAAAAAPGSLRCQGAEHSH
jgi:cobalt-zinc-cadmium efflux system protein